MQNFLAFLQIIEILSRWTLTLVKNIHIIGLGVLSFWLNSIFPTVPTLVWFLLLIIIIYTGYHFLQARINYAPSSMTNTSPETHIHVKNDNKVILRQFIKNIKEKDK
jgi:hypothetical protein